MSNASVPSQTSSSDRRTALLEAVDHLDHVLPGQAPILNFVHHNTLHGYQHLPFAEALSQVEQLTGIRPYLPEPEFRQLYRQGRITQCDIDAVLQESKAAGLDAIVLQTETRRVTRGEVWRIRLVFGIEEVSADDLRWQIEHNDSLVKFQDAVPASSRAQILANGGEDQSDSVAVSALWRACLASLEIRDTQPEQADRAEAELQYFATGAAEEASSRPELHRAAGAEAWHAMEPMLDDIGVGQSLRGLLLSLTGIDLLHEIRPALVRICAAHLDEGLAAWSAPDRRLGLYASWRQYAHGDPSLGLAEFPGWRELQARLPSQSVDAVILLLQQLGIAEARWAGYLRRLALEIPGWSGIINWRAQHPGYDANDGCPASLMDYLAIRLFLDKLWLDRICRDTWGIEGRLDALEQYALRNRSEFSVRLALFSGKLPEYLASAAQRLVAQSWNERGHREIWRALADQTWCWTQGLHWETASNRTAQGAGWRLFQLAQYLGLSAEAIQALPRADAERLLRALDELPESQRNLLWLKSYERNYREPLFKALSQNRGRGRWRRRDGRPSAQVIFCMDDREESIRRHLEELDPALETLGAAGFFGVAMNWRGLDDVRVTPLCPVVVTPTHEVSELPRQGLDRLRRSHERGLRLLAAASRLFHQELRRNLVSSGILSGLLALAVLPLLAAKTFAPRLQAGVRGAIRALLAPDLPSRLAFSASPHSAPATPEKPRHGFTDDEQADRVTAFLRNVGLTNRFAPLVVLVGHGSISQNNPHLAAYDCGACSGRHGGPNARAFAAMANRPEVRQKIQERGIEIPEDTWFLGTEHNTCNEEVLWFDLEDLPRGFAPALQAFRSTLDQALLLSAHERCRRFASAPRRPSLRSAMRHVVTRAADFSQARPELGHATNAAAIIGRRALSRGAFLDRRVFLISYDPSEDAEGRILEGILLAVGPVGAGINLEYYFSTVNNDRFGCGSKVPHNVTGLFAVMEGTSSDLRTGLPRQMIEIHEAMRLQVIVEATEEVLAGIYQRQPPLRELIGNGWILLSAVHPDTGAISVFDPERGFVPWSDDTQPLPVVDRSGSWYQGHTEPRPPCLIDVDGPRLPAREATHAG
ncbi:DUF2309 domain-containing protein [Methyloterricola oryzae]|uniref:DUF2309 domain-containing protein n=1 Tax=Methyloterricola oryzae TaxID=1495050 RepID=UPI0005EAE6ED|nr:DUF2309 domain-containing protein [Methyloterricola oryzae]